MKYTYKTIARLLFSLEYPFFLSSVTIYSIFFIIYCLVFTLSENSDAIIALGIIFFFWGWAIWAYQLYVLITKSFLKLGARLFSIPTFLWIVTVYQFTMIYSVARDRSSDVFVGIIGDFSRISIIGLCSFLAVETNPGLGTGSVFANTSEPWGPLTIALNSITGWVLIGFISSIVVITFDVVVEERIRIEKMMKKSEKYRKLFYKKYNQWLYTTTKGKLISYALSFEYPYFLVSVPAYFALAAIPFTIVFSLTKNSPAIVTLGVVNMIWGAILWGYQLYLLLTLSFRRINITVLTAPAWLFFINLIGFGIIYSTIRNEDSDAFIGLIGGFSQVALLGLSEFLSSETSTGLGTGATYANNTTWVPFLMVATNSVFFTVLSAFFLSTILVVFSPHLRKYKMKKEKK